MKPNLLYNSIRSARQYARRCRLAWDEWRHLRKLKKSLNIPSTDYAEYLQAQLSRTLHKQDFTLPARAKRLIDELANRVDLTKCDVLCVGCRNTAEIDYLLKRGARSAIGIDLYSNSDRILVMDMHAMTFKNDLFDIVYSSHSLEHARDPKIVVNEWTRVLRPGGHIVVEVPVQYQPTNTDIQDFKSSDGLVEFFGYWKAKVIFCDELPPGSDDGDAGTRTARGIFRVDRCNPQDGIPGE